VVSTSIGSEGNKAKNEIHILLRDDAESFASAIVKLLNDLNLRVGLGQKARELAVSEYSWHFVASEFSAIYETALAGATQGIIGLSRI
jgi:glycosyltransferase involved in cell wall biosynthesis